MFAVARLVTAIGAGAVVTRKLFAAGAAAYSVTLVDTKRVPAPAVVRVHRVPPQPVAVGAIAKTSTPGAQAYTGVETRSATVLIVTPLAAGQLTARLLLLCEIQTCVPAVSVPMPAAVNFAPAVPLDTMILLTV